MANHGITLADIAKAGDGLGYAQVNEYRAFLAGIDERSNQELGSLIDALEIDVAWLYSGKPSGDSAKKSEWPRWFKPTVRIDNHLSHNPAKMRAAIQAANR